MIRFSRATNSSLAEEPHQAIGDDHGRPITGEGVQPLRVPHVCSDGMSMLTSRDQAFPSGQRPQGSRRRTSRRWSRRTARGVQPCTEVESNRVRGGGPGSREATSSSFFARSVALSMQVRTDMHRLVVVVERADDLVGHGVAKDGLS